MWFKYMRLAHQNMSMREIANAMGVSEAAMVGEIRRAIMDFVYSGVSIRDISETFMLDSDSIMRTIWRDYGSREESLAIEKGARKSRIDMYHKTLANVSARGRLNADCEYDADREN